MVNDFSAITARLIPGEGADPTNSKRGEAGETGTVVSSTDRRTVLDVHGPTLIARTSEASTRPSWGRFGARCSCLQSGRDARKQPLATARYWPF